VLVADRFVGVFISIESLSSGMIVRRLQSWLGATVDSGGSASQTADRGQSELVGTVLILGLSMAVIGTSVALGGVALGDLVSTAEADNVENGMSHLSSQVSLVALGDADSQRFSLGTMREGTVTVRPDAGSIRIYNVTDGSRELLNENATSLGAIVYEGGDREIAYQGGGIWTKYDNTSRLTSPPEYHYQRTTLTLPIINVTGEGTIGGQPRGRITPVEVADEAVDVPSPLESGTIAVEIQSDYYEGWYEFLSQRTEGVTAIDHDSRTVVTTLTVPDRATFETALSVGGPYSPHPSVAGDVDSFEQNYPHRSAKPLIQDKIDAAETVGAGNGCLDETGSCELSAGSYLYDGDLSLNGDLDLDTSGGNITVIVDGTLDIGNHEVTVTDSNPDHGVTYYINDSLQATGDAFVGTDDPAVPDDRAVPEADRNVFYVGKGLFDSASGIGTVDFDAVIYAPDATLDINGNGGFTGSIIVDEIDELKGSIEVEYDSDLADTTIDLTGAADLITYLHVSHNEIRVELTGS